MLRAGWHIVITLLTFICNEQVIIHVIVLITGEGRGLMEVKRAGNLDNCIACFSVQYHGVSSPMGLTHGILSTQNTFSSFVLNALKWTFLTAQSEFGFMLSEEVG